MHNLFNSTPVSARWLVDADHEFSSRHIDLINERFDCWSHYFKGFFYHQGIQSCVRDLCNSRIPESPLKHPFYGPEVPNDCLDHLELLFHAVYALREAAQKAGANLEFFVTRQERTLRLTNELISDPEILEGRKLMLSVVSAILCHDFSYEDAARHFGVRRHNVRRWVGIFLNYGPMAFLCKPSRSRQESDSLIAVKHLQTGSSHLLTSIRCGFLNHYGIKRVLHHARLNRVLPTPSLTS